MLQYVMWANAAALLLAAGWWASARHHQRRIDQLELQLKVTRQTAQAHTEQARRQIGKLQAELAARPPAPRQDEEPVAARRKVAAPDRFDRHDDGFPQTAVIGDAFKPTQLLG